MFLGSYLVSVGAVKTQAHRDWVHTENLHVAYQSRTGVSIEASIMIGKYLLSILKLDYFVEYILDQREMFQSP